MGTCARIVLLCRYCVREQRSSRTGVEYESTRQRKKKHDAAPSTGIRFPRVPSSGRSLPSGEFSISCLFAHTTRSTLWLNKYLPSRACIWTLMPHHSTALVGIFLPRAELTRTRKAVDKNAKQCFQLLPGSRYSPGRPPTFRNKGSV